MQPQTKILIIAATESELAPARELLGNPSDGARLACTGVGKVSAALATSELIQQSRPDWIIQTGCAGAYPGSGLALGDAAIASLEIFADEGVEAPGGFLSMEDIGLPQASRDGERIFNEVPVDSPPGDTLKEIRARVEGGIQITTGRFCTISCGSGTAAASTRLEKIWDPLVESMEGAAAALAAWKHGIRFSEVRGVSNLTGDRDRESWKIPEACESAASVIRAWIETERAGA